MFEGESCLMNNEKKVEFDENASKNMVSEALWSNRLDFDDVDEMKIIAANAVYQLQYLYFEEQSRFGIMPMRKFYNILMDIYNEPLGPGDLFPRKDLEEVWKCYQVDAITFPPNRNEFDRLQEIYHKIKESENDDEAWFEAIQLFKDIYFVEHNMEARIGDNLMNKKLWHAYLAYLEENDHKTLLQTYSKYVRVFQDEDDMVERYRKAAAKYGPVLVPWKNPLDFEIHDPIYFEKVLQSKSQSYPDGIDKSGCAVFFNTRNMINQDFSVPLSMIVYIRNAASAGTLHKLYNTCKFFYLRRPTTICYQMRVSKDERDPLKIIGQAVFISEPINNNINLQKMRIVNKLEFFGRPGTPSLALSEFMPRIMDCTAKHICIHNQVLSMNNFHILAGNGAFYELQLINVKDEHGRDYLFDDLFEFIESVVTLVLKPIRITESTLPKLCDILFENELCHVEVYVSGENEIDANAVDTFQEDNPDANVFIKKMD